MFNRILADEIDQNNDFFNISKSLICVIAKFVFNAKFSNFVKKNFVIDEQKKIEKFEKSFRFVNAMNIFVFSRFRTKIDKFVEIRIVVVVFAKKRNEKRSNDWCHGSSLGSCQATKGDGPKAVRTQESSCVRRFLPRS